MGKVVQFPQAANEPSAASIWQRQLEEYLSAVAESGLVFEVAKDQIKKDIEFLASVARSSNNPALRERTQRQLSGIKDQLLLVSLRMMSAQVALSNLAASAETRTADA